MRYPATGGEKWRIARILMLALLLASHDDEICGANDINPNALRRVSTSTRKALPITPTLDAKPYALP